MLGTPPGHDPSSIHMHGDCIGSVHDNIGQDPAKGVEITKYLPCVLRGIRRTQVDDLLYMWGSIHLLRVIQASRRQCLQQGKSSKGFSGLKEGCKIGLV
jgi:hypothetical protein